MLADEDEPKKAKPYQLGQLLEEMSVSEIAETIEQLENEIERLKQAKQSKSAHLNAAEALFKS